MTIEMIIAGIIIIFIIAFILHNKKDKNNIDGLKPAEPDHDYTPEEIEALTNDYLNDGATTVEVPTLTEVVEVEKAIGSMTKKELLAEAIRQGIKVSPKMSKSNILNKLQ